MNGRRQVSLGKTPMRATDDRVVAKVDFEDDLQIYDGVHEVCIKSSQAVKLAQWILQQEEFLASHEERELGRFERRERDYHRAFGKP